jgi:hypothetical protein
MYSRAEHATTNHAIIVVPFVDRKQNKPWSAKQQTELAVVSYHLPT